MSSPKIKGSGRTQDTSGGYLQDFAGTHYDLAKLRPYHALFAPNMFAMNASFEIPILIASYDDGSSLLVEKNINEDIIYAELRKETPRSIIYYLKTQECKANELFVFADSEVDGTDFEGLSFGDEESIENDLPYSEVESLRTQLPNHVYKRGDGSSAECVYFKVVKVGIIYDAEFCRKYGGKTGAQSRIMLIVAAASLLYENDMCVKLQLVDIYSPDDNCAAASTFAPMRRDNACGGGARSETFIRYFADWMNNNRNSIGLDVDAVFHAFTGFPPRGTLGCAYIGTACRIREYAYGVNYMDSNFLSDQSIVFAHELAHNLNARHLTSEEVGTSRYIMMPALQNPTIGFSSFTIQRVLEYLDFADVTCDLIAFPEINAPTQVPRSPATPIPPSTRAPILVPSRAPSPVPPTASTKNPTPECRLEPFAEDTLCFLPSSSGLFGCVEISSLINLKPNNFCPTQSPVITRVAFQSCEEKDLPIDRDLSNDNSRYLRGPNEKNVPSRDEVKLQKLPQELSYTASNDRGLNSFENQDCSQTTCTAAESYVCFATNLAFGQEKRSFVVTYLASVNEKSELFTVNVSVHMNDTQLSSSCYSAQTTCVDQ